MRMLIASFALFAMLTPSYAQQGKKIENIDMTKTDRVVVTPKGSAQQTPAGTYEYPRGTEPRPNPSPRR